MEQLKTAMWKRKWIRCLNNLCPGLGTSENMFLSPISIRHYKNIRLLPTCRVVNKHVSNIACTSDATSNQRQHAPPHPTQPYVQRSVHIRCNFKPTSTCPTPPHPDPYLLMWVEARTDTTSHQAQLKCNQALSNQSFPSESLT